MNKEKDGFKAGYRAAHATWCQTNMLDTYASQWERAYDKMKKENNNGNTDTNK